MRFTHETFSQKRSSAFRLWSRHGRRPAGQIIGMRAAARGEIHAQVQNSVVRRLRASNEDAARWLLARAAARELDAELDHDHPGVVDHPVQSRPGRAHGHAIGSANESPGRDP